MFKRQHIKIMLVTMVAAFMMCFGSAQSFAQSGSYLDTLYQAADGNSDAVADYSDYAVAAAGEEEGGTVVIPTDDPNATVTVSDDPTATSTDTASGTSTETGTGTATEADPALEHVNLVLADMTRIVIGMNLGVPINMSSFTLIDLTGGSSTGTETGSSTETGSGSGTGTGSSTETGSGTGTGSSTETGSGTGTGSSTETGSGSETGTGSSTETGSGTGTGSSTETGSGTGTGSSTETGSGTGTGSSTETGSGTGTGSSTETGSGSGTGTGSSTETGSGSGTGTSTSTDDATTVEELKAKISSKYGITVTDSTSKHSKRQLELMDQLLARLPEAFRKCTTEVIREKELTDDEAAKGDTLGYVIKPESKVHILDKCISYTEEDIKKLEEVNGRTLTQTEVIEMLEYQYQQTLLHEMTHCYANRSKDNIAIQWYDKFWPNGEVGGTPPNNYAKTAYGEDFAESVSYYCMGGIITEVDGKKVYKVEGYNIVMDIDRYNFIKNNVMGGKEFLVAHGTGGISI